MRRLFALAFWLPVLSLQAAQVRIAPQSVQLSFAFAPAKAGIAPPPAALAPSTLARAPMRASIFSAAPSQVLAAFHTGDAAEYLKAARAAEYQPPESDDQQTALYQLGLEREAAERAFRALGGAEKPVARKTAIDYAEFGRQLARHPGLSANPFQHAAAKRRILKASGYSRLYGAGGKRIPIEHADDVRVGKTFANVLAAYARR